MTNTKTLVILLSFMVKKSLLSSQACRIHQRHPVDGFFDGPGKARHLAFSNGANPKANAFSQRYGKDEVLLERLA